MERGSMSNNTINHALDNFLENCKDKQSISSSLTVEINAGLNFLNIRGSIENEDFLSNAEKIFHQPLPTISNTFTTGTMVHDVITIGNCWSLRIFVILTPDSVVTTHSMVLLH